MILCPECGTWRRLKRSLILPHYPERDDRSEGAAVRCPGSARRLIMDITVEEWGERLATGEQEAASLRASQQFYKPLPEAPVPVARMARALKSQPVRFFQSELNAAYEQACEAVALHRAKCATCRAGGFCGIGHQLAERRSRTEATREEQRKKQAREQKADQTWERRRGEEQARRRANQWRQADPLTAKYVETRNAFTEHKKQCGKCKPKRNCEEAQVLLAELAPLKDAYNNRRHLAH
jgi:hypothetical protein